MAQRLCRRHAQIAVRRRQQRRQRGDGLPAPDFRQGAGRAFRHHGIVVVGQLGQNAQRLRSNFAQALRRRLPVQTLAPRQNFAHSARVLFQRVGNENRPAHVLQPADDALVAAFFRAPEGLAHGGQRGRSGPGQRRHRLGAPHRVLSAQSFQFRLDGILQRRVRRPRLRRRQRAGGRPPFFQIACRGRQFLRRLPRINRRRVRRQPAQQFRRPDPHAQIRMIDTFNQPRHRLFPLPEQNPGQAGAVRRVRFAQHFHQAPQVVGGQAVRRRLLEIFIQRAGWRQSLPLAQVGAPPTVLQKGRHFRSIDKSGVPVRDLAVGGEQHQRRNRLHREFLRHFLARIHIYLHHVQRLGLKAEFRRRQRFVLQLLARAAPLRPENQQHQRLVRRRRRGRRPPGRVKHRLVGRLPRARRPTGRQQRRRHTPIQQAAGQNSAKVGASRCDARTAQRAVPTPEMENFLLHPIQDDAPDVHLIAATRRPGCWR